MHSTEPRDTPLHTAAREDSVKSLRQALTLLKINIDAQNQAGQTALHITATDGNLKSTKYLCQREASLDLEDMYDRTPLHYAVKNGHPAIVIALLSKGIKDTKEDDDGNLAIDYAADVFIRWMLQFGVDFRGCNPVHRHTALGYFSLLGNREAVNLILEANVDPQERDEQDNTALMLASLTGKVDVVRMLCGAAADGINAQDEKGNTALMLAAAAGHLSVVKVLLENQAEIDKQDTEGHSALIKALYRSHLPIADALLLAGSSLEILDRAGYHPLGFFTKLNQISAVSWLIKGKVKIDAQSSSSWTALLEAAGTGHYLILRLLIDSGACMEIRDSGNGYTALQVAVQRGDIDQVSDLLEAGANPNTINKEGWTPLAEASFRGRIEILEMLLDKGVFIDTRDDDNRTPLHISAKYGQYQCARLLLEHKAHSSPQNKGGWSPLEEAANQGNADLATLLIHHKAELELKDNGGYTPLCRTAQSGRFDCLKLLLEKGANISAQNNDGWTALAKACFHGRKAMVELLLEKGADTELVGDKRFHRGERDKKTPLMKAAGRGHEEVVRIMVYGGACQDISSISY